MYILQMTDKKAETNIEEECKSQALLPVTYNMVKNDNKGIDVLLKAGETLHCSDEVGGTILRCSMTQSRLKDPNYRAACVEVLLQSGASVNIRHESGSTILMKAVADGYQEIAKEVIYAGGDVNSVYQNGQTVLMEAIRRKQWDVVILLIREGAVIRSELLERDTPICAELRRVFRHRQQYKSQLWARKMFRQDLMSLMPGSNLMAIVEKLKFIPQLKNYILYGGKHNVALQYTVMKGGQNCPLFQLRCANLLVRSGANVNMDLEDMSGVTVLMAAVDNGYEDIAKLLIHAGANVNVSDKNGQTLVMKAIGKKQWDVVKYLIMEGAEITAEQLDGNIAVCRAVNKALEKRKHRMWYAQYRNVVRKDLIRIVPTANIIAIVQKLEMEPVLKDYVIYGGHDKCLGLVLKCRAYINVPDERGNTCLINAARVGHQGCVKFLIDAGANVHTVNLRGETAVMKAAQKGHNECVRLLMERAQDRVEYI